MDESYSSLLAAGIEKKYRQLEMEIMEDVVRRIRKAGTITDSADWQINRLRILGTSAREIEDMLRKAVRGNEEEVRRLYAEVIEREYTRDKELYEKAGKDFIPYEQNPELQQITDALVDQSSKELYNITKSAGFMIEMGSSKGKVFTPLADVYNDFLDDAITGMVNGAYDYNTLVKRMVSRMTGSGLRTDHAFKTENGGDWGIDYASGWHNRIDVAARRALLTGFNQLAGTVTDMNAQRLGTNLFEVSWHPGARPSHTVWQGRIYTREELASKCGLGTGPGLCGWSCHHSYYAFVPGVSTRNWSDAWLKEMNARENTPVKFRGREYTTYQAAQKQRQMETALRARREQVQLLRHAEADPHDITTARCKYQTQLDEYKRFSRAMKLPEQMERIYTGRTGGRIAPSPQTYAKWQAEQINNAKERQEKKRREDMEAAQKATPTTQRGTLNQNGELGKNVRFRTGGLTAREYAEKKSLEASNYSTVRLEREEYATVMHALQTDLTAEEKQAKVVHKVIGNNVYTAEVLDGGYDFRIIGREEIPEAVTELFERE